MCLFYLRVPPLEHSSAEQQCRTSPISSALDTGEEEEKEEEEVEIGGGGRVIRQVVACWKRHITHQVVFSQISPCLRDKHMMLISD